VLKKSHLWLLVSALMAVSMWYYVDQILIPHQIIWSQTTGSPRGNLSDLYPRWIGARELLLHGRDPYSAEITREAQIGYYGRALDTSRQYDPKDQQGFVYPVYVALLLAPFVHLPFALVQVGFRWVLILVSILSIPLWQRAVAVRFPPWATMVFVILTLGSFPWIEGLKLQQLSLLVGPLLAASLAALASGYLALSGILLAIATIKPQLTLPLAAWLVLWTLAGWKSRKRWFYGFAATMALLVAGGEWILPGWIPKFRAATDAYRHYTEAHSILYVCLGNVGALIATVILLAGLALWCWRARQETSDSDALHWTIALVLAITLLVIPMFALYNFALLLPALMLLIEHRTELWLRGRTSRALSAILLLLFAWPWVASLGLSAARLALPLETLHQLWSLPLYTSLMIPIAVLAPMLLILKWRTMAAPEL
jgi:glycosyl transferase family 87